MTPLRSERGVDPLNEILNCLTVIFTLITGVGGVPFYFMTGKEMLIPVVGLSSN